MSYYCRNSGQPSTDMPIAVITSDYSKTHHPILRDHRNAFLMPILKTSAISAEEHSQTNWRSPSLRAACQQFSNTLFFKKLI
jgi:hypothetical protein